MNNVYVEAFKNQTFNRDGKVSAFLKIKCYNQPDLLCQHLPVKGKVKNIEVNRIRSGYIVDTLTIVDIQKSSRIGGKVIEIYKGVIYRENIKISPFRKVIEKLFVLRQKYRYEGDDLMQSLDEFIMNSL